MEHSSSIRPSHIPIRPSPSIKPNPKKRKPKFGLLTIKIFHPNGQFITLRIDPNITIMDIKDEIEHIMGIYAKQQQLSFQGEILMDERTLRDYNFPTAIFVSVLTEVIQIFIKTLTGKTIAINANETDEIVSVKEEILYKEGIAIHHQTLIFGGKHLEDHHSLCDYGIESGSTLYLALKFRSTKTLKTDDIKIFIKTMSNKTIATLIVKRNYNIDDVKRMIERETNVFCEQQQIIFAEQCLEDDQCLANYNIYNNSVLYLLDPDDDIDDIDDQHYVEYTPSIGALSSCSLSTILESKESFEIRVEIPETGTIIEVEVEPNETIQNIKSKIEMKEIMPPEDQILIYLGKQLDDTKTLLYYDIDCIGDDVKVELQLKLKGFTKFLADKLMSITSF